jgi:hypothetical protein
MRQGVRPSCFVELLELGGGLFGEGGGGEFAGLGELEGLGGGGVVASSRTASTWSVRPASWRRARGAACCGLRWRA